ncbi:MAG TPA: HPF/RaiA family ribosome-associated protein [Albitalea sp.]|nr:HPF/RaiA family ribosome-associated protein [Albitalea sp.]
MKLPLQISFRGMQPSEALETAAREKAQKLERFCADIVSCRVVIELQQKHQQQGRSIAVGIVLTLPGRELSVSRVQDEDAYIALRDAFDDMRRQLEDAVRRTQDKRVAPGAPAAAEPEDEGPRSGSAS